MTSVELLALANARIKELEEQYEDLAIRADERSKQIEERGELLDRWVQKYDELQEQLETLRAELARAKASRDEWRKTALGRMPAQTKSNPATSSDGVTERPTGASYRSLSAPSEVPDPASERRDA